MMDFNLIGEYVGEFSRNYCFNICVVLVPANVIAVLQVMLLGRSPWVNSIIAMSIIYAALMIFHVFSWFVVGVVMAPTFILLGLAIACLGIDGMAIIAPAKLEQIFRLVINFIRNLVIKLFVKNVEPVKFGVE
jgi:hypothetical protein